MSADVSQSPEPTRTSVSTGWRLVLRGVEVRLRFAAVLLVLAGIMAGWSWIRAGWERFVSTWTPRGSTAAVSADSEFFCPMDPGVISAWPAICPICNMDLIPRKKSDAVLLPEGVLSRMQLSPYRVQLAGVRTSPARAMETSDKDSSAGPVMIPATAVVMNGDDRIVYVETMPGMFDGVRVQLGERIEDEYAVVSGLQPGQRVVTMGAFLIDAETRLNSNLATQYFGAKPTPASTPPALPQSRAKAKNPLAALSETDQAIVKSQKICPVTEADLGSMGTPVFTMVEGRKVFLCCKACEGTVRKDPEKYLARLPAESPSSADR